MRIIISERQKNIILENQVHYTEEKLQEFFKRGIQYLAKVNNIKNQYANKILMISFNEIIEDTEKFLELKEDIKNDIEKIDDIFQKLYNVVEMYEITNRPDVVSRIEYDVVNKIEHIKYDIEIFLDVLESAIDLSNDLKKVISS